ncbi:hypothetical protein PHYBOEH_009875 [Phytophthora boehmeriae]|uniref:RxLR effector protein n=1 Tax=Phytophthora boehmeriae TaxID=109152 RepID=A0A8T1VTH3_9STRA|nr:hypothetical protein PHYBOEH_009875 [Phytophthora boehmeriae]
MGLYQLVLVVVVAYFASCDAVYTTIESGKNKVSTSDVADHNTIEGGRLLRVQGTTEETDNESPDTTDTEERGALSSLTSKLSGLKSKVSAPLTYTKQGFTMDRMVKEGVDTSDVWALYKLPTGINYLKPERIESLKTTAEFKAYMRYAKKHDHYGYWRADDNWPGRYGSAIRYPVEEQVRAQMWAQAKRSKKYVLERLGLSKQTKKEMQPDPNYRVYLHYLKLTGQTE